MFLQMSLDCPFNRTQLLLHILLPLLTLLNTSIERLYLLRIPYLPLLFLLIVHVFNFILGLFNLNSKYIVLMLNLNLAFSQLLELVYCFSALDFKLRNSLIVSLFQVFNLLIQFLDFCIDVVNLNFIRFYCFFITFIFFSLLSQF